MSTSKENANQRLKLLTFPSLTSITLAAVDGVSEGIIITIGGHNVRHCSGVFIDGKAGIGLVQQPLEHSMVTVDLVADLLILDDYDATLNDTVLIGISELG